MTHEIWILVATAASIGFVHTLLGPDHYLPFIVMSKARKWSTTKTVLITSLCGLGHVLSSVVLGIVGIAFGLALHRLELVESVRGDWAAWAFVLFGLGYLVYAFWRLQRRKEHSHIHTHGTVVHSHEHDHRHEVSDTTGVPHSHDHDQKARNMTPWILFLIFVLGPCEPLIPILMYPAAEASTVGLIAVTTTFAVVTIATMLTVVLLVNYGVNFVRVGRLEKYMHVIAGATIALSGVLILIGL
jgi:ABC-type nickel/cobalt efflux system permease component RcnA